MTSTFLHKTLSNGMEVYLHPSHAARVVSLQILVKVGSIDEEDHEGGMAHVLEHMLFKGTKKFSQTGQIALMVEAAGGDINAYTTFDHTNYYLTAPSHFTEKGTEILLDVVQNSLLDSNELKKELEVVLEEIKRGLDNPNSLLSYSLFEQIYKNTRMARPIIGFREVVEKFTQQDLFNFYKKWYSPNNMIFIAAGDFDEHHLYHCLENLTQNFSSETLPKRVRPSKEQVAEIQKIKSSSIKILDGDWQQARVQFALFAPALEDPHMPAWDVMSAILGENDSSRLTKNIKNELELVTSIDASNFSPQYPYGLFSVGFLSAPKNVTKVLNEVIKEIIALAEVKPSQAELLRVSNALKASRIYDQESVDGLTRNASLQLLTSKKLQFEDDYFDKIEKVTAKDIQEIAKQILVAIQDNKFSISCAINKNEKNSFNDEDLLKAVKIPTEIYIKSFAHSENLKHEVKTSSNSADIKQICISLPFNKKLHINFNTSNRLPITSGMLIFRGGLTSEPQDKNGLSGLTATMLTHGTIRQNYRSFVEELEDNAASISAFSGRDTFGLRFESLADNSIRTLQMMLDCLFRPGFSQTEWARVKKETLEILNVQKDNPSTQLSRIVQPLLYPNHSYQNLGIGSEESVLKIELSDVEEFWKNLFLADKFVLSLAGDFNLGTFLRLIESEFMTHFSQYQHAIKNTTTALAPRPVKTEVCTAFYELNREQCHIMLCFRGADILDERRTVLEMAANILAGQGGRLFLDLRDEKSLAYSLHASQSPHQYGGAFVTYIACATHKVEEAFKGLKAHIKKLAHIPPTHDELERARQSVLGARSIESQYISYQASQLAMSDVYDLDFDHFTKFEERLNTVTPNMVSKVLKEFLSENALVFAAVGSKDIWFPTKDPQLLTWKVV